jgi:hypothetical protein
MESLKNISIEVLKKLPEPCTLEDIMYELNLVAQVMDGLKDAEDGKTMSTSDLLKKIEQWGK